MGGIKSDLIQGPERHQELVLVVGFQQRHKDPEELRQEIEPVLDAALAHLEGLGAPGPVEARLVNLTGRVAAGTVL